MAKVTALVARLAAPAVAAAGGEIGDGACGREGGGGPRQSREGADGSVVQPLRRLIRLATPEDLKKVAENHIKEKRPFGPARRRLPSGAWR